MGSDVTSRFAAFTVDRQCRVLSRGGQDVHLTPKAFDLLIALMEEAPRVLTKSELHKRLWPATFVSDATLAGVVKELRRALDDRDGSQPVIRIRTRVGYAFAPHVDRTAPLQTIASHWLVGSNKRFPLQAGENTIGRDPASAVWLDAASVSRRHARLALRDSLATLEDLRSKNGTRVGNVSVTSPVTLQDGDRIKIGTIPLTYRRSDEGLSTETSASAVRVNPPSSSPHARAEADPPPKAKR